MEHLKPSCRNSKTCISSTCSDCVLYMPNKKPFRINWAVILGVVFCIAWWVWLIWAIIKTLKGLGL